VGRLLLRGGVPGRLAGTPPSKKKKVGMRKPVAKEEERSKTMIYGSGKRSGSIGSEVQTGDEGGYDGNKWWDKRDRGEGRDEGKKMGVGGGEKGGGGEGRLRGRGKIVKNREKGQDGLRVSTDDGEDRRRRKETAM